MSDTKQEIISMLENFDAGEMELSDLLGHIIFEVGYEPKDRLQAEI